MSKALGCKRVHDDRVAGVTFEENALRNALIVNEEYAWVGNPFSALDKRVIINELSLVFIFLPCVVDVCCVTRNSLKSPFVIHKIV